VNVSAAGRPNKHQREEGEASRTRGKGSDTRPRRVSDGVSDIGFLLKMRLTGITNEPSDFILVFLLHREPR
jgi:hypothetical protein